MPTATEISPQITPGAGGVGVIGSADQTYLLTSDGSVVTAYDHSGAAVYSGADGGAALAAVLPAANSFGATIQFRNDGFIFPWSTVPGLPKGITNKLLIDLGGATVRLSSGGPRFLDFNKTADYDTFQNIEVCNGLIDCNNIGGQHHVVLGNYASAAISNRLNFQDIALRRITTINVPVDSTLTNHRLNVYIISKQTAAGEGTQNFIRRVTVADCKFSGGNMGVTLAGVVNAGTTRGLNVLIEDCTIDRTYHSLLTPQVSSFASAHFFIGSGAKGGLALNRIRGCYGEFSGDVGVECDSVNAVVEDTTIVDCRNSAFFVCAFNDPLAGPGSNVVSFKGCVSVQQQTFTGIGFAIRSASGTNASPLGQVIVEDCTAYKLNPTTFQNSWAMIRDDAGTPPGTFSSSLRVERFNAICTGMAYSSASAWVASPISIHPTQGAANTVILKGISHQMSGASSGGATITHAPVSVYGTNLDLVIDGLREDLTGFTGLGANGARLLHFGVDGVTTLAKSALIRDCAWVSVGDCTNGFGLNLSSSNLTVSAGQNIQVEDCDFSKAATLSAANAIIVHANNKSKTVLRGINWKTKPAPATLTGLVTGTGKTLDTVWPALISFVQGSGAAITAIDVSTNDGTTYTNVLTQASGALPAGFSQALGPLPPDALIKVTFTTTQPTINLIPVNP